MTRASASVSRSSRAIAQAHGGTVTVEDADPPGARFVITLPTRPPAPTKEDPWPAS